MKFAIVHWSDAYFKSGEITPEDREAHSLDLVSVGHLLEQSEQSIKLAMDHCPEQGDYRELQVIPMEYVQSAIIWDLDTISKPSRKKKRRKSGK